MWVTLERAPAVEVTHFGKKDLGGLILDSCFIIEWAIERERSGLPTDAYFCFYHSYFSTTLGFSVLFLSFFVCSIFFLSFFLFFCISCLPFFSSFFLHPFHCACLWPSILPVVTGCAIFTP